MKRNIKLTRSEQAIERAIARGEYRSASQEEFDFIAKELARRKKDAVLSIRVNSHDLENLKKKTKKMGIPYQSFVSELIHKYSV